MKKTLLLVNGASGTGVMERMVFKVITALALDDREVVVYPVLPSAGLGAREILSGKEGLYDEVVCCGGDGTLHHVVNALMEMENRPALGYVPAGSTNDFAVNIGMQNADMDVICRNLVNGVETPYDIGRFNDRYFDYIAAFGAFVPISYATDQKLKNILGHAAYFVSAFGSLQENLGYSTHMRITADEEVIEGDFLFGAVYSSLSIAGMRIKDSGFDDLNDGVMDLLAVKRPNDLAKVTDIANALITGGESDYLVLRKIKHAVFESQGDTDWTLDGEYGGTLRTARIDVLHKAIDVIMKAPRRLARH